MVVEPCRYLAGCAALALMLALSPAALAQTTTPVVTTGTQDPSPLTIDTLRREILGLREQLEIKIEGGQALNRERIAAVLSKLEQRLDDMDKGIILIQAKQDKVPSETDVAVTNLRAYIQAKLDGIAQQFANVAENTLQSETKNKTAIDAALEAQAKLALQQTEGNAAISAKAEASFTKSFEQIADLVSVNNRNLETRIVDISERLTRIEGTDTGAKDNTAFIISMVAVAGTLITMIGGVITIIVVLSRHAPAPVVVNGNGNGNGRNGGYERSVT